jgi:hypothetical protein
LPISLLSPSLAPPPLARLLQAAKAKVASWINAIGHTIYVEYSTVRADAITNHMYTGGAPSGGHGGGAGLVRACVHACGRGQ